MTTDTSVKISSKISRMVMPILMAVFQPAVYIIVFTPIEYNELPATLPHKVDELGIQPHRLVHNH